MGWCRMVNYLNRGVQRRPFRRAHRQPHHQWNVLKTQLDQLIRCDRLEMTLPRAKELQQFAEEVVLFAKKNTTESSLIVESMLCTPAARRKLYHVLCPLYAHRNFFVTRVVNQHRLRMRDAAPMAYIEFVDRPGELRPARPVGFERKKFIFEEMQRSRRSRRHWWNHARKLGLIDRATGQLVDDVEKLRRQSAAEWEASDSEAEEAEEEKEKEEQQRERPLRKVATTAEGEEGQDATRPSAGDEAAENKRFSYRMVKAPRRALEPFYVDLPPPNERYRRQRFVYKRFKP